MFKKGYKTLLASLLLLSGIAVAQNVKLKPMARVPAQLPVETLIDEDFSLMKLGTEDEPDTTMFVKAADPKFPYLADSLTHKSGWSGQQLFQAGGALCLGDEETITGFINTPRGDYSGELTVTLRVKNLSANKAYFSINLLKGDLYSPQMVADDAGMRKTIPANSDWRDITFTYNNTYGGSDCGIQFNCNMARLLIDDIKVVSRTTVIPAPTMKSATDFVRDGFTAHWSRVGKATDYLMTLYAQVAKSDADTVDVAENFEGVTATNGVIDQASVPEGWEIKFHGPNQVYTGTDDGVIEGSTSLCMSADGDTITTPYNGGLIKHWKLSGYKVKTAEDSQAQVLVEVYDGTKWVSYSHAYLKDGIPDVKPCYFWLDYNIGTTPTFYQVRFIAKDFGDGITNQLALDDLIMTTTTPTENIPVFTDSIVADTAVVLRGLNPEYDYCYYAKARNTVYDMVSDQPSKIIQAFGVATPEALQAVDVSDRGYFDAKWTTVPKATSYLLDMYNVYQAPADVENFTVMDETFNGEMNTGTIGAPTQLMNLSLQSMDDYTDNPDWYGLCNIVAVDGLGVDSKDNVFTTGELQSPELDLAHGDSIAHIIVKYYGTSGDYLIVTNRAGYYAALPMSEEGTTVQFDMPGCQSNEILDFYAYSGSAFLLDQVTVQQNIKKGEQVWIKSQVVEVDGNATDSYHFSDLEEVDNMGFGYTVQAKYHKNNKTAYSSKSGRIVADPYEMGIANSIVKPAIHVEAAGVYDLQGRKLSSLNSAKGIVIIKKDGQTRKVLVK